jgi:cell division ATPase FtsA
LVLGAGLKELKSFSLGGGHITADLSKHLDLSFEEAEDIKKDVVLTINPSGTDYYTCDGVKKFAIKNVNDIIVARIDRIRDLIVKCIDGFEIELPKYIPIFMTGGGLNYIEGISDYFRKTIERPVEKVSPKALLYRKPDLSSSISVLNMALNL